MEDNSFLYMVEESNNELRSVELGITLALGEYYTEALVFGKRKTNDKDGLWTSIKKFFVDLLANFQEFNRKIIAEVQYRVKRIITKFSLKSVYKKALHSKENGTRVVKVHNVAKMVGLYNNAIIELSPIMKRVGKADYTDLDKLDNDVDTFTKMINSTIVAVEKLKNSTINVSIDEYIKFLEREISGNSQVFSSLDLCERDIQLMQSEVLKLQTKRDMLGPEVLAKKINIMKRISLGIVQFIKDCLTKLILFINAF
jgi:hypothetical protein|nr:MAG TPA: hypothetical protein [Caudoviricetes sp.]